MAELQGIYFRRRGSRNFPAAVLIHGAGGNGSLWMEVSRRLAKKFWVLAPDLPGHGRSSREGPFSDISQYARAVSSFIKGLGLNKVLLVGHSMGGAIALEIALKEPELLAGLVLMSTGAKLRVHPAFINTLKEDPVSASEFVIHAVGKVKNREQIVEIVKKAFLQAGRHTALSDFLACDSFDRMEEIESIKVPTLILCGKEDLLTPLKYSYYLNEKIKNSLLVTFNKCGHMLMLEDPEKVAKEIIKFAESLAW